MRRELTRSLAVAVVIAVIGLAGGACGQKAVLIEQTAPAASAAGSLSAAPDTTAEPAATADTAPPPPTSIAKAGASSQAAVTAAAQPPPGPPPTLPSGETVTTTPLKTATVDSNHDPLPLSVDAPDCVALGGRLSVKVTSVPDADVALVLAYKDGSSHETQEIGTTDAEGRYSTVVKIAVKAPPGPARLLVAAGSGGRGNTVQHAVRVVATSGECK